MTSAFVGVLSYSDISKRHDKLNVPKKLSNCVTEIYLWWKFAKTCYVNSEVRVSFLLKNYGNLHEMTSIENDIYRCSLDLL